MVRWSSPVSSVHEDERVAVDVCLHSRLEGLLLSIGVVGSTQAVPAASRQMAAGITTHGDR